MQVVRGFFMGAADIVPGVSGGTVALLFGIYERLILNIRNVATAIGHVLTRDFVGARDRIRSVEWLWLVSLLVGILVAIASLSAILERLLDEEPVRMAGLFFGLILGSVIVAWRLVKSTSLEVVVIGLLTAVVFFLFLGIRSDTSSDAAEIVTKPLWLFFLVGTIAICAMILPGISGSFLLVMMGMYSEVLGAVNERDFITLLVFAAGCAVGLALFSTLLEWLLEHHHDRVMAAMIGLMLGSLRVLWPWPGGTATTTMSAPRGDVLVPVLLALVGFVVVMGVELFVARSAQRHATRETASEVV
jgi:putative membrane protein